MPMICERTVQILVLLFFIRFYFFRPPVLCFCENEYYEHTSRGFVPRLNGLTLKFIWPFRDMWAMGHLDRVLPSTQRDFLLKANELNEWLEFDPNVILICRKTFLVFL